MALRSPCMAATAALMCAQLLTHTAAHSHPNRLFNVNVAAVKQHDPSSPATASVSANPSILSGNASWTTISIVNSAPDAANDWVGIYSPANVNVSAKVPVEYFLCSTLPGYGTSGKASIPARMINMRDDILLVLFTGGLTAPVEIARSSPLTWDNPNIPRAPRMFLTQNPTEMRLVWSSASEGFSPFAAVKPAAGGQQVVFAANSTTYTDADMYGPPATTIGYRDVGQIHSVLFTGLVPGAAYKYMFGDSTSTAGPYTFRQPPVGFENGPVTIFAFGDMGQDTLDGSEEYFTFPPAPNTSALITRDLANGIGNGGAVFHIGDISYARGIASEWDTFLDLIAPASSQLPWMINLGNHEADFPGAPTWLQGTDSGGEGGVPAMNLFQCPTPTPTSPWYWVKVGPVFAVHISTEWDFTTGSPQWTYVRNALASVNRTETPWVIFAGHRPMYIDSTNYNKPDGDQPVAQLLRQHIEPLLMDAGGRPVDLGIWGHHHSAQIMCSVLNMTCQQNLGADGVFLNPPAPVHTVIGTAGASYSTNVQPSLPPYTEKVWFLHGYVRITAFNASALQWQFVNDADGTVTEEFWIQPERS